MKITKKMFILLISIVLYSCGPSACDCLYDINGYGLRTVSQGCFDKFGNDKYIGTPKFGEDMRKTIEKECKKSKN